MSETQESRQRLVMADGTVIEEGRAGYNSGTLWCWFTGYDLPEAGAIFFDPAKTERIVYEYGKMSDVYEGYTTVIAMNIDVDGIVSVGLTKGSD